MDAPEIDARRLNAKEVITPKRFPIAHVTVKLSGRDHGIWRSTSMRDTGQHVPILNERPPEGFMWSGGGAFYNSSSNYQT